MTLAHPNGLTDLDPLPQIPHEAADAGLHALTLAMAAGTPLRELPPAFALLFHANFDRLMFDRMPIICTGPQTLTVRSAREIKGPLLGDAKDIMDWAIGS